MNDPRYIDTAEVARMLRPFLRKAFPGVKFSVRTDRYSMGASIDVGWTDGPTEAEVEEITHGFRGGRFDSRSDLVYSANSWYCPDHGARAAETYGHDRDGNGPVDSRCCARAELVYFSAYFIPGSRRISEDTRAALVARIAVEERRDVDELLRNYDSEYVRGEFLATVVHQLSCVTSLVERPAESPAE